MNAEAKYRAEYARTGRSRCQFCKELARVSWQTLLFSRLQGPKYTTGEIPKWYHAKCGFAAYSPDEREKARNAPPAGKGRKAGGSGGGYFKIEYAKSSRSTCIGCHVKIIKDEMRISKKARRYGGLDRWHHVECFAQLRADMGCYESGDKLPGAEQLSKEDQQRLKTFLSEITQGNVRPPYKKNKDDPEEAREEKLLKENNELYTIKRKISSLRKKEMIALLKKNRQKVPSGVSNITSLLSDILYFGALEPCPKCKGQLLYNSDLGYKCTGNATECDYVTQDPKRKKCVIPSDMKENFPIKSYKSTVKKRTV